MKLKPIHALVLVAAFMALILGADHLRTGVRHSFERVGPGDDGLVRIGVGDLERMEVRWYRFLNTGNQEVRFLVGRDDSDTIQVGFDAGVTHLKNRRGFSYQDGWIIDNKCETTTRLAAVNEHKRGCKPTPVKHRVDGDELIITERDMLDGWRYFR